MTTEYASGKVVSRGAPLLAISKRERLTRGLSGVLGGRRYKHTAVDGAARKGKCGGLRDSVLRKGGFRVLTDSAPLKHPADDASLGQPAVAVSGS